MEQIPHFFGVRDTDEAGVARYPRARRDLALTHRVAADGYAGRSGSIAALPDPPTDGVPVALETLTVTVEPGEGGATCPPTETGALRIRVAPAEDAVVCLGTLQDRDAFAALRVPPSGVVVAHELPRSQPIRVRVDAPGYRRHDDGLLLGGDLTERDVSLVPGADPHELRVRGDRCILERVDAEDARDG